MIETMLEIKSKNSYLRAIKKLHKNEIDFIDSIIEQIRLNPNIGIEKKGNLKGIFVYKLRFNNQLKLLAYSFNEKELILIDYGSHENFYRDL